MKVTEILKATNGTLISGDIDDEIKGFCQDSRQVQAGDMYIPLIGENNDGHKFIEGAFKAGAKAILTSQKGNYPEDKIVIEVEDTLLALQQMAAYIRDHNDFKVVAITGSVGKTSTKDLIASVVSKKYRVLKTIGNYNSDIGLPLMMLRYQGEEVMVLEMGMNNLGEIHTLSKIAKPDIAVINNVGTAHIGNLGSRENILKAKLEIRDGMKKDGILIVNNDNDLLHEYALNHSVLTFGIDQPSTYQGHDVVSIPHMSTFTYQNEKIAIHVPGSHFVLNALAALAVGDQLGIELPLIKEGIESFELTKKRMDFYDLKDDQILIDGTYNANLDSMLSSLEVLSKYKSRKVAILADMLELGEFSEALHRQVGKAVSDLGIDVLICIGKEARYIQDSASNNGLKEVYYYKTNEKAIEKLDQILKPHDIILVKGSQGMHLVEITQYLLEKNH